MPFPTRIVRTTVLAGAATLVTGLLTALPAAATGPTTSVTVLLKAPNQAALNRLAVATGLSHTQRIKALDAILPSAATHRAVASALEGAGFSVTHETAWTVEASAPASTVTGTFGAHRALTASATMADRARNAGSLPVIPASIAGLASAVLTNANSPDLFTPQDDCDGQCHDGNDFRNAYTAPDVSPPDGSGATDLTIATLQFAPWNDSDLTKYATATGAPDPVASGQYTSVVVGSKSTASPATTAEDGDDEEVDLDQQTILSTDPDAKQRAYFDTDVRATAKAYIDELTQVLDDSEVAANHIVALSTSWGTCEREFTEAFPGDKINGIENVLKSLTAAGVTIFAASGDDGVYDCDDSPKSKGYTRPAVDYPASSPEVVAVGGTRLASIGGDAANNGANWSDKGWTCTTPQACQSAKGSGGSGGGESQDFALPTYQQVGIGNEKFTTSTKMKGNFGTQARRLVPDVAIDADPVSGFDITTSDPIDSCTDEYADAGPLMSVLVKQCEKNNNSGDFTTTFAVGGTSLASPASAALFTDMLAAQNVTSGVGDIHGALYSAYAQKSGAFRDVTSGSNGAQKDVDTHAKTKTASELPVKAQKGFDTVTGLGAPLWPKVAPYIFSPATPSASARIGLSSQHNAKRPYDVTASWSSVQRSKDALLAGTAQVTITKVGSSTPLYSRKHAAATGSHTFHGVPGGNYLLTVTDTDLGGARSAPVSKLIAVPYDDRLFSLHGAWTRVTNRSDFGRSHITTSAKHALARIRATGRTYTLEVRTGPTLGKLAIFHGTRRLGVFDLYSTGAHHEGLTFYGTASTAVKARTFTFRYTGVRNPFSTGKAVTIDALYATD